MRTGPDRPRAVALGSARLLLDPVHVDHADGAAAALDDPALHRFTGGEPATVDELRARYARQARGRSPDGTQGWLSWTVRRRATREVVGTTQATLTVGDGGLVAELSWVVARRHQGQGLAREAAATVVTWLSGQGVTTLLAHVHPDHAASGAVARHLGLHPTSGTRDGEVVWTGDLGDASPT